MLGDQLLQLGHDLRVATELEISVDSPLEGRQAQLLEASECGLRELLVGELVKRRSTPQSQRLAQSCSGLGRRGRLRLPDKSLESFKIKLSRLHPEQVARRSGLQRRAAGT